MTSCEASAAYIFYRLCAQKGLWIDQVVIVNQWYLRAFEHPSYMSSHFFVIFTKELLYVMFPILLHQSILGESLHVISVGLM